MTLHYAPRQTSAEMALAWSVTKDWMADACSSTKNPADLATGLLEHLAAQGYSVLRTHALPEPQHVAVLMRNCESCGNGYFPEPFSASPCCTYCAMRMAGAAYPP